MYGIITAISRGLFLSTPSARRATVLKPLLMVIGAYFYPRPPRGGRRKRTGTAGNAGNFYPRPPRGGRLTWATDWRPSTIFLSTPSARRATLGDSYYQEHKEISIHALREEGDLIRFADGEITTLFLSTPSARRATAVRFFGFFGQPIFLSTPSARRATSFLCGSDIFQYHFYPRPPRGGRHAGHGKFHPVFRISIHALREEGDRQLRIRSDPVANFYPRPPRGGRRT